MAAASFRPATGSIPTQPGVYRFRDARGRVIYVGKAKNLRARLSSYFQDIGNLHARTATMVTTAAAVDWTEAHNWELRPLDEEAFPAVRLAKQAGQTGHCRPAIYNAANEECVAAFVAGRLPFLGIVDTLEQVLTAAPEFAEPGTVEDVLAAEAWARAQAQRMIATVAEGA